MTTAARRILFASEYYPPFAPGGGEYTNQAWAEALVRAGHHVVVATLNYGAPRRETTAGGVVVVRMRFPKKARSGEREVGTKWRRRLAGLFDAYFQWQIRRITRSEGVDVIHAQSKGVLVPSLRAARRLGLPVVVTIRDVGLLCPLGFCTVFEPWKTFDCSSAQYWEKCVPYFFEHYDQPADLLHLLTRRVFLREAWRGHLKRQRALAEVDGVVGVSRGILDIHPERIVPATRRHVVYSLPSMVDPPTAEDAARVRRELHIADGPLVLYAGRFSHSKGGGVLAEALDRIRAAVPGVRFAFAGTSESKRMPVPGGADVHALGMLPHARLFPLYRAADIVVVPSIWPEPLSRVIVEAMSFGRPVVATAVGGSPEAIEDGVTGLLVPKSDPLKLADAIVTLLRDPARRERMGEAAQARAREIFSEDKVVAALLDAYAAAERRSG